MKSLLTGLILFPLFGWGQLTIDVNLMVSKQPVRLNQPVQLNDHFFQLEQARFYLSKFEFYQNDQLIAVDSVAAYLIDFENDSTRKLIFPQINAFQVNKICFLFGIDSITNTSGAMSGALDPMHGMYWSWQSGYINCKLEGTFSIPKQEAFQFHLGGYVRPFSGVQQLVLKSNQTTNPQLNIDLSSLMNEVIRSKSDLHVMSPSIKAVEYTQLLTKSIELKP
ncbi:MbnP family protein [Fluviicola sp.]|uniref:MbnP family protein n=1 Tax=Fluviicola sp. TaxID=1917219 RepID=UPI0026344DC2|nr:MbnP family protein [Fluviicola sp.]